MVVSRQAGQRHRRLHSGAAIQLMRDYGEDFTQEVISNYALPVGPDFMDRVVTRIKGEPIFESAYALEYGFGERFERHLSEIEVAFGEAVPDVGTDHVEGR